MELKWTDGELTLGPGQIPETVTGLPELLQNARMRLALRKGSFPYGRELGSGLAEWDPAGEHREERALELAGEALLEMPGVRAKSVTITEDGFLFGVETPLGEGEISIGQL